MKTLKPVDKETYERIGAAYAICSQYPEVFGNVTMRKFCSMFVDDIIDEGEDEKLARIKAAASEMYRILKAIDKHCEEYYNLDESILDAIYNVLEAIDGEVTSDE